MLKEGIGSAPEVEEGADPKASRKYLASPSDLIKDSALVKVLAEWVRVSVLYCVVLWGSGESHGQHGQHG